MILLTAIVMNSNVELPLPHVAGRVAALKTQRRKPLQCGIFMRKNSVPHHYAGLGKALFGGAGSLGQYCNLIQSGTMIAVMLSGLKTLPTEAVMPKSHATNPLNNSVSNTENQLIEISNLIDSIAGRNARSTQSESSFIDKIGKPLMEMTLAELMAIDKLCTDAFNAGIEPNINQVKVSPTKAKSLHKQHEIIGYSLDSFCLEPNEIHRACTKSDALELLRMLDDLPRIRQKTSRFNILTKSKELIAERVPYEQAIQYQDVIVKFAGMEYSL